MMERDGVSSCVTQPLSVSEHIKIMPACLATDMGQKSVIGWECENCPASVRAAVAAAMVELGAFTKSL